MKPSSEFSFTSILKALGLTSSATLIALGISAVTNKILSVSVGPEGIGMMGIFRNLGSLVGGVLTLGYTTLLVQQVSKARSPEERSLITQSSLVLFTLQTALIFLLAILFSQPIERFLFTNSQGKSHALSIKIVLAMALVNILLQSVIAVLRGQSDIKRLSYLQIITALASLAMIYPLTQWGELGLAVNVGSGSLIGILLGTVYLKNLGFLKFSWPTFRLAITHLKSSIGASFLVTVQTLTSLGGLLLIQTLIQRSLGMESLGNYNAAMLLLDTIVLVLMSAVRSYLLPMLAKTQNSIEKARFFSRFLTVMLSLATLGTLLLSIASPFIIRILFSDRFHEAEGLLRMFGFSLIGLTLVWMYNTLLLHYERHFAFTLIDSLGSFAFVLLVYISLSISPTTHTIGWAYLSVTVFTGLIYMIYVSLQFGKGFLPLDFITYRRVTT